MEERARDEDVLRAEELTGPRRILEICGQRSANFDSIWILRQDWDLLFSLNETVIEELEERVTR